MTYITVIGGQGSGKGTQIPVIQTIYNLEYITTGGLFREFISAGTNLGKQAEHYVNKGKLVPDKLVFQIVKDKLTSLTNSKGALFDGIPRTLNQAKKLDGVLRGMGGKIDIAIYIEVPPDVLLERIVGRRICPKCSEVYHLKFKPPKTSGICDKDGELLIQRDDDQNEKSVKQRLDIFFSQTTKMLRYYQSRQVLITINGNQSIEEVADELRSVLTTGS